MSTATLPERQDVLPSDTWDLSSLYADEATWERDFRDLNDRLPQLESYRGRLGESAELLYEALRFDSEFDELAERLGTYAFLKTTGL